MQYCNRDTCQVHKQVYYGKDHQQSEPFKACDAVYSACSPAYEACRFHQKAPFTFSRTFSHQKQMPQVDFYFMLIMFFLMHANGISGISLKIFLYSRAAKICIASVPYTSSTNTPDTG